MKIVEFFRKNFTIKDVLFIFVLIALFFTTRLINLKIFPIFTDEGIYIHWAKVAARDASWRFISLTDGRQPLQTWGTIPFLKLFPNDSLLAGRLFAVATGFAALLGTFTLNFYLFKKRGAFIASLLYIFIPYFVFYDRMALVDSAVNAGFVWILFFSILLAQTLRFDVALLFGFTGGFVLLAKSSSRIFIMLSAFAPLLFISKKRNELIQKSINYFILLGIVLGISLLFYNIQRLSQFFHQVEIKNTTFVMTFAEFQANPLQYFTHNFKMIPLYITWESGWFIVPFSILGMILLYKKNVRLFMYLLAFFILPYIAISFFAKVLFPRYLIFFASLFIVSATYFFTTLKHELQSLLVGLLLGTMIIFDYPLLFNPTKASFPPVDRGQYVEGIAAVWGAQDLVEYVRQMSVSKPSVLVAEGDFGLVGDVLSVFVKDGDNIDLQGEWPLELNDLQEYQLELKDKDVYVAFSHRNEFPSDWPIEMVKEYKKPVGGDKSLYLFKLKPNTVAETN
jgi:4-amino-4-deoxy-L-arabinose transferase-like glycosyltransferase